MLKTTLQPSCVFCDDPAEFGWVDRREHLTPVCRGHRWIAVAACGSAQAEFVHLERPQKKQRATPPPAFPQT